MKIAIVGCGEVGIRTARLLQGKGHCVVGIRRNVAKLPDWLESKYADVGQRASLQFLSREHFDIVLYSIAASGFNEPAYQRAYVDGIANTMDAMGDQVDALKRFIFVSSTAVYHQNDGSIVDEDSPTTPVGFNGQLVLEGERHVNALANGTVVRFSGIYGPGRTRMIDRVKNNLRSDPQNNTYTNRIHVDDCAGVLAHMVELISQRTILPLYLASDCLPCTRGELESFLASELGVAGGQPEPLSSTAPEALPSTAKLESVNGTKRIAGSKRCSNSRLLQAGYQFSHADFRSGYRQMLRGLTDR